MKRFLIIVICVMLVAFSLAAVLWAAGGQGIHFGDWENTPWNQGPASKYGTDINQTGESDIGGVDSIRIEPVSSPIHIEPAEGDTFTAHLLGTFSANREDAQPKLIVKKSGGSLTVEVKYPHFYGLFSNAEMDLTVSLPAEYAGELSLETSSAYAESSMPLALERFSFNSVSGEMNIWDITAREAEISTSSGRVNTQIKGCETFEFNSVSGDIEADIDAASVRASTTSGRIVLQGLTGGLIANSISGSVTADFAALTEDVNVDNTSGRVSLTVPGDSGFSLRYETVSGSFHSDLPVTMTESSPTNIEGRVGEGGPNVRVNTISGGLNIAE